MADRGTVGRNVIFDKRVNPPRDRTHQGLLTLSGTAQLDEVAAPALVWLMSIRGAMLCATRAATNGSFTFYGLAAGRYFVIVGGEHRFLPGIYAVDVA